MPIKPVLVLMIAAAAAVSGCATDGNRLPPLPTGGGGFYVPYSLYGPGYYYGYGGGPAYYYGSPGYDPLYRGYGVYSPSYYMGGAYPYGPYYNPFTRYVVVPCVDNNHDGHCDSHPGKHHDAPSQGGNDRGHPYPGRHEPAREVDGHARAEAGSAIPNPQVRSPLPAWTQPPALHPPQPSQPRSVDPAPQHPRPRHPPVPRADDNTRLP